MTQNQTVFCVIIYWEKRICKWEKFYRKKKIIDTKKIQPVYEFKKKTLLAAQACIPRSFLKRLCDGIIEICATFRSLFKLILHEYYYYYYYYYNGPILPLPNEKKNEPSTWLTKHPTDFVIVPFLVCWFLLLSSWSLWKKYIDVWNIFLWSGYFTSFDIHYFYRTPFFRISNELERVYLLVIEHPIFCLERLNIELRT